MHQFNGPRMKRKALVATLVLSGLLFTGTAAAAAQPEVPSTPAESSGPWLGWLPGVGWMPHS